VREAEGRHEAIFRGWLPDELRPREDRLALLIDFENLVLGAGASLPGRDEPVPAKSLTWLCQAYGPTTIRPAYADGPTRASVAPARAGAQRGRPGAARTRPVPKNGADIRMTVDAMETLIVHPSVDAFVLASGDSD
jgi:hypothetical protein